jgi:hypothetical protein
MAAVSVVLSEVLILPCRPQELQLKSIHKQHQSMLRTNSVALDIGQCYHILGEWAYIYVFLEYRSHLHLDLIMVSFSAESCNLLKY